MIVKLFGYSIKMLGNYKVIVDEFGIFKDLNLSIESIDGFNFIEIFNFFNFIGFLRLIFNVL